MTHSPFAFLAQHLPVIFSIFALVPTDALAQQENWQPPRLDPVAQAAPSIAGERFERRALEVSTSAQGALRLCPSWALRCKSHGGLRATAAVASRSPHFAWGAELSWLRHHEQLFDGDTASLTHENLGAEVFGQLYPMGSGRWEPYVKFGFGGGHFAMKGEYTPLQGYRTPISEQGFAPTLTAGLGVDRLLTDSVRIGLGFNWINWLVAQHERCNGVAFGICSNPGFGHFSPDQAVWSLGLNVTGLFGSPH